MKNSHFTKNTIKYNSIERIVIEIRIENNRIEWIKDKIF